MHSSRPLSAGAVRRWNRFDAGKLLALVLGLAMPFAAPALCEREAVTPAELRGLDEPAVERGKRVVLRGVVSGRFLGATGLDGFYVQARADDGRPAGIFVYAPRLKPEELPDAGRQVAISGRADRYRGRPELDGVRRIADCGVGVLEPVSLSLPLTPAAAPRWAEVLVQFEAPAPLVVTGNRDLYRFGSLELAVGERLFHSRAGVDGGRPAGVTLDDGAYRRNPRMVPYVDPDGSRRVGSRVGPITGVLTRAFDAWRVHPVKRVVFADHNPRPHPPPRTGELRAIGFNVENYFTTLGERGAASVAERDDQRRALREVVEALKPDVLALQEIENRPAAVADLIASLNRGDAGGPFAAAAAAFDSDRGAIRNAIIYREDRLRLVNTARLDDDLHARSPLAADFVTEEGHRLAVVSAHFKSKGGCRGDALRAPDGGCWGGRRLRQAASLGRWIEHLADHFGHRRLLLLGDLNSQPAEAPARLLRERGLTDLLARDVEATSRYTYIYDGRAGVIDHALATPELAARTRARIWHINADEPYGLPASGEAWRSSDHDPVIVDLRLSGR